MSIIQKNILGDNHIYLVPESLSRSLTPELKDEIISIISEMGANSVVIRYEHGGETSEFSNIVAAFLKENGIHAILQPVMMSEIRRNELSIQRHTSDPNYVIIKIGPLQ